MTEEGKLETTDKVFWKVVKQCNYLLELQSEIRMLTDHLTAESRAFSGNVVPEPDVEALGNIPETDPNLLQLAAFKKQERECVERLEETFLELAELEIATLSESVSAEEMLYRSSSTVRSVVENSIGKWNAVLAGTIMLRTY